MTDGDGAVAETFSRDVTGLDWSFHFLDARELERGWRKIYEQTASAPLFLFSFAKKIPSFSFKSFPLVEEFNLRGLFSSDLLTRAFCLPPSRVKLFARQIIALDFARRLKILLMTSFARRFRFEMVSGVGVGGWDTEQFNDC